MRASWTEPYLWLHLAGFASVPLWLDLCWLGLAAGDPILPVSLEFGFVALVGTAPVLWMQWQRPFCIYSLLIFALRPSELSDTRRRLLRFFRTSFSQLVAIALAVALIVGLWTLYRYAPLASDLTPFSSHWVGLGVAAIAFLATNLFTQVPASVLRVLLVSDAQLNTQDPYPAERIPLDFVLVGIPLKRILPDPPPPKVRSASATPEQPAYSSTAAEPMLDDAISLVASVEPSSAVEAVAPAAQPVLADVLPEDLSAEAEAVIPPAVATDTADLLEAPAEVLEASDVAPTEEFQLEEAEVAEPTPDPAILEGAHSGFDNPPAAATDAPIDPSAELGHDADQGELGDSSGDQPGNPPNEDPGDSSDATSPSAKDPNFS